MENNPNPGMFHFHLYLQSVSRVLFNQNLMLFNVKALRPCKATDEGITDYFHPGYIFL